MRSPAPRPKCLWCSQIFSSNGRLGRHYDLWVYSIFPRRPDEEHTEAAIEEMGRIRKNTRRMSLLEERNTSKQSAGNRPRRVHPEGKRKALCRENRDFYVARTMALYEIQREGAARDANSHKLDISPDASPSHVNFATIVYEFLPHWLFLDPEQQISSGAAVTSGWRTSVPAREEYWMLGLLLDPGRNPERSPAWMQRLASEWKKWKELEDVERAVKTMEELGRALGRERLRVEALQYCAPTTIQARVQKWESRIRELRKLHGSKIVTMDKLESLLVQYMDGTQDTNGFLPGQASSANSADSGLGVSG